MSKVAQTSILNQIRSALNGHLYSMDYQTLTYSADEFVRCFDSLEHVHVLVDDAALVWSYIVQTVSGWMPSPGGPMMEYNTPEYNARELFCLTVLDLARNL